MEQHIDDNQRPEITGLSEEVSLEKQFGDAVRRIEVLHRLLKKFDLGSVVNRTSLPTEEFVFVLKDALGTLENIKTEVWDIKLSKVFEQLGSDFTMIGLVAMLPEIPEQTILLMEADISELSEGQIVEFALTVVPNLSERRPVEALLNKKSQLLFVFSGQDYERYRSVIRSYNDFTRTLDESNTHFRFGSDKLA